MLLKNLLPCDGEVYYIPNFLESSYASSLFDTLRREILWKEDSVKVFNKVYLQPRLTALYGSKSYTYSGLTLKPHQWIPALAELKTKVEDYTLKEFNVVLCNLYRHGKDSNGWHRDNEKELGYEPFIASLSLGEVRRFRMRHRVKKDQKISIDLAHGSLLLMSGRSQDDWEHCLTKTSKDVLERINLTFRTII